MDLDIGRWGVRSRLFGCEDLGGLGIGASYMSLRGVKVGSPKREKGNKQKPGEKGTEIKSMYRKLSSSE